MNDAERNKAMVDIIAKEQIRDLVLAYCRAIDRKDFSLLASLYHEGAGDEHGCNPSGTAAEFFAVLPGMMESAKVLQHNITNHFIKVDGDYGEGEAYLAGYHIVDSGDGKPYAFLQGARYLDKYTKVNGVWKFAHRRVVTDYFQRFSLAPDDLASAPEIQGMLVGSSSGDDNSYGYFSLFKRGCA